MIKTIKKIAKIAVIISALFFVTYLFYVAQKCGDKPLPEPTKNEYLLPSNTYRPPLVKIPLLTKDRAPVSKANLPIPKKDVKTTIVVKNPVPGTKDITIIIDKKGKVYKSKDTPEDAKIEVTHWKPALLGLQSKWGASLIMAIPPDLSFALSWDPLRIWKFHFGVELGAKLTEQGLKDAWLGTSVKYRILRNNNLFALVGYNWTNKSPYIGVMMRF